MTNSSGVFVPAEVRENKPALPLLRPVASGALSSGGNNSQVIDIHDLVVKNQTATYFFQASDNSMTSAGIHDGDILAVDNSKAVEPGKVVIAVVEGRLSARRLIDKDGRLLLVSENYDNPNYPEIDITEQQEASVWGVVTYCLHSL